MRARNPRKAESLAIRMGFMDAISISTAISACCDTGIDESTNGWNAREIQQRNEGPKSGKVPSEFSERIKPRKISR